MGSHVLSGPPHLKYTPLTRETRTTSRAAYELLHTFHIYLPYTHSRLAPNHAVPLVGSRTHYRVPCQWTSLRTCTLATPNRDAWLLSAPIFVPLEGVGEGGEGRGAQEPAPCSRDDHDDDTMVAWRAGMAPQPLSCLSSCLQRAWAVRPHGRA